MKYKDFLHRLTEQFEKHAKEIMVEYNFDYGPEFEKALCRVLRKVLPQKYGICRGYVVSAEESAGDDIIIYDRERFPTLRFSQQDQFETKEYVPVEAVYAYIEAKYTLNIEGGRRDKQSYQKACEQVARVKKLPRERAPYYRTGTSVGWPDIPNPMYGAIFAYRARKDKDGPILEGGKSISRAIVEAYNEGRLANVSPSPDLVVIGNDVIMVPLFRALDDDTWEYHSPFYIEGSSFLINTQIPNHAVATGFLMLLSALDNIQLGRMPWHELINEALREAEEAVLGEYFGEDT